MNSQARCEQVAFALDQPALLRQPADALGQPLHQHLSLVRPSDVAARKTCSNDAFRYPITACALTV